MTRQDSQGARQTLSSIHTRVEQALAFGRSLEWMETNLGVTPEQVARVAVHMNQVVAEDPPIEVIEWENAIQAAMNRHPLGTGLGLSGLKSFPDQSANDVRPCALFSVGDGFHGGHVLGFEADRVEVLRHDGEGTTTVDTVIRRAQCDTVLPIQSRRHR